MRPNSTKLGPPSAIFGKRWAGFGQSAPECLSFDRTWPGTGQLWPDLGQSRPVFGQHWPNLTPDSGQSFWFELAWQRPSLARCSSHTRPKLARTSPTSGRELDPTPCGSSIRRLASRPHVVVLSGGESEQREASDAAWLKHRVASPWTALAWQQRPRRLPAGERQRRETDHARAAVAAPSQI